MAVDRERHQHRPVCFRPACEADRLWLMAQKEETGRTPYAVMAQLLTEARKRAERAARRRSA